MVERGIGFPKRRVLRLGSIPDLGQAELEKTSEGRLVLQFGVAPIPFGEEEIIPAVSSIVKGEGIDFTLHKSAVPNDWGNKMTKTHGLFLRSHSSMFGRNPGEQAQRAITILNEDLKRFKVDTDFLHSSEVGEFLFKLTLGVGAHNFIGSRSLLSNCVENKNAEDYKKTTESQMIALEKALANLNANDLDAYIRFEDILQFYGSSSLFTTKVFYDISEDQAKFVGKSLDVSRDVPFVEALAEYRKKEDGFRISLIDEGKRTWDRLRKGWTEEQVSTVVSLFPQLKSPVVILNTILALEDNLSPNNLNKEKWVRKDSEGLLFLLKWKWDWSDMTYFVRVIQENYEDAFSKLEESINFPSFSVPRKHLPSTAIALLDNVSKKAPRDEFVGQLRDIHNLAVKDKQAAIPWFLTLVVLKNSNPFLSDLIDEMVGSLDSLPEGVAETFLNKRPGKIWLRADVKIFVAKNSKNYSSAFPVVTSSKEEDVPKNVQQNPQETTQKPEIKKPTFFVDDVNYLPFFREVGGIENHEVKKMIGLMFDNKKDSLDEDELLTDFGRLQSEWKTKGTSRELLYITSLNNIDKYLNKAKRFGINAIYVNEGNVIFVLDENVNLNGSKKTVKLSFRGSLDGAGQLLINGMGKSFIGEKEQLFLNNLILHLTSQIFIDKSSVGLDKEARSATNATIANWNRSSSRGDLPKLDPDNGGKSYIAILVDGLMVVLVGEKSK